MDIPSNMQRTILWASLSLGGVGLFGSFTAHADLVLIAPAWATLAHQAGSELDKPPNFFCLPGSAMNSLNHRPPATPSILPFAQSAP